MSSPGGILSPQEARFARHVDVLIVGAGSCGLCAALSARERGASVLVLEREPVPLGTTARSIGFIPAAGTRFQKAKGIEDPTDLLVDDIMAKNKGQTDQAIVRHLVKESAPTVEWLADKYDIPLSLFDTDVYPGHSRPRMHGTPNRTGAELMRALCTAAERAGVEVKTNTRATHLFSDADGLIQGVRVALADGATEDIGCGALVLACSGFAANRAMIADLIPEIQNAYFYGHEGSQGDAIRWGQALGAEIGDIHAYQSHGGMAYGKGISVPWAHILRGGIQVNATGKRFSDESRNYAERAIDVVAQPGHAAWSIFDQRIHETLLEFQAYQDVLKADCVYTAADADELCRLTGLPPALKDTLHEVADMAAGRRKDPLGRDFTSSPALVPPYKAVKVTGALYHTQGGLTVDTQGRVLKKSGGVFPNLFAGGGAARGISGPASWGYLAGNGLLTAVVFGRLAGAAAAGAQRT